MADLTFNQELVKAAVGGVVPTVALVAGGRWLLDKYDLAKKNREQAIEYAAKEKVQELEIGRKRREQTIELARFIRQRQYEALQDLYSLFAEYMSLFRLINSGLIDLTSDAVRLDLLRRISLAEGRVDATILRVASEFAQEDAGQLGEYLANLRQSVQLWRENVRIGEALPFGSSEQPDYARFKNAFVQTCTHLASQIYQRLEPTAVVVAQSTQVLSEVFSNKHEWRGAR